MQWQEIVVFGAIGGMTAVAAGRLAIIIWKTRKVDRKRMTLDLEMNTDGFGRQLRELTDNMEREIQQRIGEMSTEDIVRAMMGRELVRQADQELMTGVEGTTESIPPGTIPYTTSHTRPLEEHHSAEVDREATRVAALLGVDYEGALRAVERAIADGTHEPGGLPFIDPATGRLTYTDPGEVSEPPPILYIWMDAACHAECHIYDETHSIHEHAHACILCERYAVWYHTALGGDMAPQIFRELVEPPTVDETEEASTRPDPPPPAHPWMRAMRCYPCPHYDQDLGPDAMAARCRGEVRPLARQPGVCPLYAVWRGEQQDLAPSDTQADAAVPPRCPWMNPAACDPCSRRTPRILPGTQAVLCAGHDDDPSAFECSLFDRWREANPTHGVLCQLLHREKQAAKPCIRVIRFRPDK